MKIERRQFDRYQVPDDMFYILSNYSNVKGWVKDISKGGMAFVYFPTEGCKPKKEIRVILASDKFPLYLPDIPCKIVRDIEMNKDDRCFRKLGARRCCLQYAELDIEMEQKLVLSLISDILMSKERNVIK